MPQSLNIQCFQHFLDLLETFRKRNNSLFNLSKFFEYWDISEEELEPFTQLLIRFQLFLLNDSGAIRLRSIWRDTKLYLQIKSPSEQDSNIPIIFREIELKLEDSHLLNDVIHYFEHINIGKGFKFNSINSDFAEKIKKLHKAYPFFFENRGDGAIYPTKLASKLGRTISLYKKSNRSLQNIEIEGYHIRVR